MKRIAVAVLVAVTLGSSAVAVQAMRMVAKDQQAMERERLRVDWLKERIEGLERRDPTAAVMAKKYGPLFDEN